MKPMRGELAAALADFHARQQRAILRPVQLGRERLETRAQRLPAPAALLQPQAQRLDDLSDRLRRALGDRAARGRERLGALRLSPAMLERNARDARAALARIRLDPVLLANRASAEHDRIAALGRLLASLDPKAPLARGFALVRDDGGALIRTGAAALRAKRLVLQFADGAVGVATVGSATGKPAHAKPARTPPVAPSRQDDLFG